MDNNAHKDWVKRFAARLRADGIDARLDIWDLRESTIPDFMDLEIRKADWVIMICTPEYQKKIYAMQEGEGVTGSGWESMLITAAWFYGDASGKIIPIIARGSKDDAVPSYAQG